MKQSFATGLKLALALSTGLVMANPVGAAAKAKAPSTNGEIIHDAEFYVLEAQNGPQWATEDQDIDAKIAALKAKYGRPPNIIHFMWDDSAVGDVGIPAIQITRGFSTPNINRVAAEGLNMMRMYTEPACTSSRAAVITGRLAVRSGMHTVSFPVESSGMDVGEVTMATVLGKAGYNTAFYGKWHLGDTQPSYPVNMGFDEALWTPYNQVPSAWTPMGEMIGVVSGMYPQLYPKDPYLMDNSWQPAGTPWILDGTKGGAVREWGTPLSVADFYRLDQESLARTLAFAKKATAENKPFYVAFWPVSTAFLPNPEERGKLTTNKSLTAETLTRVDKLVGGLVAGLKEQGIDDNTLVIVMADNGAFTHDGPPGMVETLYRGGKGDYLEGGVRVPAFAYWPGVIKPGQISGDMIFEADLFTTFAHLANAEKYIPRDRIIDGIDQTSLLFNGDGFSRRDYHFIYQGTNLSAAVKGRFKRVWAGAKAGLSGPEFYDLYVDPREEHGLLVPMLNTKSMFNRQLQRHNLWITKYPNRPGPTQGPPLTGIENARPATKALSQPPVDMKKLPFDPREVAKEPVPFTMSDQD